jgi:two-component system nitrogen regulation sensor histidine kinase NtrY
MKLRTKYILFVAILNGVALLLSYFVFDEQKILFIASEVFIIISIILAWRLYAGLIRPLKLLTQGKDAIKDRDFNIKFVETGSYEMDELIKVYNQMIDELRLEKTKQEEQHFFLSKLINTSPIGIIILDYDGKIQQINPRAIQLLGITEKEVLGKTADQIAHPIILEATQMESGQSKTQTFNGPLTYKLQKSHFIDRGFPRHFVMIEELTAEILAAEKNAYGKVIRMMAHEVNNTIGPVNSIIESALQSKENSYELTNALLVAMERNNNLNIFMRNFADLVRIPLPQIKSLDLSELIKRVTDLMHVKAAERQVVFQSEQNKLNLVIHADPQQMEQVLINILKNALEAIDGGGSVSIIIQAQLKQLIIRDTGKGISAGVEGLLFSPFYSTKKDGQGLGLTLIREILINHGFHFSLKTIRPGRTEFLIQF